MQTNKLNYLLYPYLQNNCLDNVIIQKIELDSRKINKGDIFIAIRGNKLNGNNFIYQAIENGAIAVLTESNTNESYVNIINNVIIVSLNNLDKHVSEIAGRFYQHPSKKLKTIAVTGTNGKTSVTHLLSQWANLLGERGAVIGTIGNGLLNNLVITKNTTDSAISIQKLLHFFLEYGVQIVAIEVSSHGLVQNRVKSLSFDVAVFTNLTHDHLDYHGNMINYELSKKMLFFNHIVNHRIINADDKVGYKWLLEMTNAVAVSINNNINIEDRKFWLKTHNIIYQKNNIKIILKSSWGNATINSFLIGSFNITNILLALSTLLSMNYSLKDLVESSHLLKPICGRMELFQHPNKPKVIIDYAHTPEALKKALQATRLYCKNNIWCVFGCGGNRDVSKRPIMGNIAKKYSDIIVITSDNPRHENAKKIIQDITDGILDYNNVYIIYKRKKAIIYAIKNAKQDDVILITGKGHESYQIVGNKKIVFSDKEIVCDLLKN